MHNVTEVYHCAAIVTFSPARRKELYKINIEGTANVVNAALAANVRKLVHVSSVAALGRLREGETINETMSWTPETSNSVYGQSKFLGEMEVWRGIGEGLNAVIINPVVILGAGDWNNGSSQLFKSIYDGFPWYSDGVTGFVDVQDVAKAMIALMESDIAAQKFIVSAENKTYKELFDLIADAFGKKRPTKKITPLLASIKWRMEAIKAIFTGRSPLVTKETAATALAKVYFDNKKLLAAMPAFTYQSIEATVKRVCAEIENQHTGA